MKKYGLGILLLFFLSTALLGSAQSNDGDPIISTVRFAASEPDWVSSGIAVKQGDFVFFEVSGTVSLGIWAGYEDGSGKPGQFWEQYSKFKEFRHGSIICSNGSDRIASCTKSDLKQHNPLNFTAVQLDFLLDNFVGNLFVSNSDQELRFAINDADCNNNEGHFKISVRVFKHDFDIENQYLPAFHLVNKKPQPNDVIIYRNPAGRIIHSGIVTKVDPDGTVTEVISKFQEEGKFVTSPSAPKIVHKYGNRWEIYHTDRAEGEKRNRLAVSFFMGVYVTDKGNVIKTPAHYASQLLVANLGDIASMEALQHAYLQKYFYLLKLVTPTRLLPEDIDEMKDFGYNCHGLTFTGGDGWITDGWPVERILHDNAYELLYRNEQNNH